MPDTEEVKPETTTEAAAPQSADKAVAETPDTTVEAATSEAADPAAVIADLQNRLAQAEAQAAEYKDQWMRAVADYRNFKRRTETERTELVRNAGAADLEAAAGAR